MNPQNTLQIALFTIALSLQISQNSAVCANNPIDQADKNYYLYEQLIAPQALLNRLIDEASCTALQASCAFGSGVLTASVIHCYLGERGKSPDNNLTCKKNKQLLGRFFQPDTIKAPTPGQGVSADSKSLKRDIFILMSSALLFYLAINRLGIFAPTPQADRITQFIASWPTHKNRTPDNMHDYFDELYALYQSHGAEKWRLDEPVATQIVSILEKQLLGI